MFAATKIPLFQALKGSEHFGGVSSWYPANQTCFQPSRIWLTISLGQMRGIQWNGRVAKAVIESSV